ncbi:hypothetical protein REPUB_Repub05bG0177200 [Reevesia pubescens]
MDTLLQNFSHSMNRFEFNMAQNPVNGSINSSKILVDSGPTKSNHHFHVTSLSSGSNSDGDSPYDGENIDFFYAVLNYINDVRMEEDGEGRPCMLQGCLALQAAEKSFYDVLAQKYHPSPDHLHQNPDIDNDCPYDPNVRQPTANNLVESSWNYDQPGFENSTELTPFSSRLYC